MTSIRALIFTAVTFLCVGCDEKGKVTPPSTTAPKPADTVRADIEEPIAIPCSDGTVYAVDEFTDKVLWLVNGKAIEIKLDDRIDDLTKPMGDFTGGLYVVGMEHLWYIKSGVAEKVALNSVAAIRPDEHMVTAQSANWASLATYGREQLDKGREAERKENQLQRH